METTMKHSLVEPEYPGGWRCRRCGGSWDTKAQAEQSECKKAVVNTEDLAGLIEEYAAQAWNQGAKDTGNVLKYAALRLRDLNAQLAAQQWRPIEEAEKDGRPHVIPTRWTLLPTARGMGHFAISIDRMQSPYYQGDRYAVRAMGGVLSVDGQWEIEPQPSSRDDAFYEAFRFKTFDDALKAAWKAAAKYKANRLSVYNLPPAPQGGEG